MRLPFFVIALITLFSGSMAAASSVQNIDLQLGYAGTSYFNVRVLDTAGNVLFSDDILAQADDVWGLPRLFSFAVDEVVRLTTTLDFSGAGRVVACTLGGDPCVGDPILDTDRTFPLSIFDGRLGWLYGGTVPGSTVTYDVVPGLGISTRFGAFTASGDFATWFVWRGQFAVLDDLPELAPVPLPAPAFLLMAGIGALGLLRRRQVRPVV